MSAPATTRPAEPQGGVEDLVDYELLRHFLGFGFRAVRRHRRLTLGTFVAVLALGLAVTALLPRTYHVEATLLANRSQLIRSLSNPRGPAALSAVEDPTRAAQQTVIAHGNLVSLIKRTRMVEQFKERRALPFKIKDALWAFAFGPMSEDDEIDALVTMLEKRLGVAADGQTVTISVSWADPVMAFEIVEAAQQSFLEQRHLNEMNAISTAISILEAHAGGMQKQVEEALAELQRVRELRSQPPGARLPREAGGGAGGEAPRQVPALAALTPTTARPAPPPAGLGIAQEQELAQIKSLLQAKKRARADLEESRARRLVELRALLAEQKVMYADRHPAVLDTMKRVQVAEQDTPQLVQLQDEIRELLAEYQRKGGQDPDSAVEPQRRTSVRTGGGGGPPVAASSSAALFDRDPLVDFAQENVRVASTKYEDLMSRIEIARIEQDTAREAFKYRYSVVRPPRVPKRPLSPKVPLLVLLSVGAALGAALVSGGLIDLWRRRFVEGWQVERSLGLKVLSHVTREP